MVSRKAREQRKQKCRSQHRLEPVNCEGSDRLALWVDDVSGVGSI